MFKICLHSCVAECRYGVGTGLQMNLRFKDTDRLCWLSHEPKGSTVLFTMPLTVVLKDSCQVDSGQS